MCRRRRPSCCVPVRRPRWSGRSESGSIARLRCSGSAAVAPAVSPSACTAAARSAALPLAATSRSRAAAAGVPQRPRIRRAILRHVVPATRPRAAEGGVQRLGYRGRGAHGVVPGESLRALHSLREDRAREIPHRAVADRAARRSGCEPCPRRRRRGKGRNKRCCPDPARCGAGSAWPPPGHAPRTFPGPGLSLPRAWPRRARWEAPTGQRAPRYRPYDAIRRDSSALRSCANAAPAPSVQPVRMHAAAVRKTLRVIGWERSQLPGSESGASLSVGRGRQSTSTLPTR